MKRYKHILHCGIFCAYMLMVFACHPVVGTPWYPRTADVDLPSTMYVINMKVDGQPVTPFFAEPPKDSLDARQKFAAAAEYFVTVPYTCTEISAENITVEAAHSLTKSGNIDIEVEIVGGRGYLTVDKPVPVIVKIKDNAGLFETVQKVIKVTRTSQAAMQKNLELVAVKIHDIPVMFESDLTKGSVTLPYSKTSVSAGDIKAIFKIGSLETMLPVDVEHTTVELIEGEAISVVFSVKEHAGQWNAFSARTIHVMRDKRGDNEAAALKLTSLVLFGQEVKGSTVLVPVSTKRITSADFIATFEGFSVLDIMLEGSVVSFDDSELRIRLSVPETSKHLAWETEVLLIKDPSVPEYNPQDPHGRYKYKIDTKTITKKINPFDYYHANFGFPAAQFDKWIVQMPRMSGKIATYKFLPGNWTGIPDQCDNPNIGEGFGVVSNVKCYRYKTRAERWSDTGQQPFTPIAPMYHVAHEKRFYFYRFTGSVSMVGTIDNSMFCVDTHSKFLFYYSEPSYFQSIMGIDTVPQKWMDYNAPARDSHQYFEEPFYKSDPVGFVKENGDVVIYDWVKTNINNNYYHAAKNTQFSKPAEKRSDSPGYSPYRDDIAETKVEVVKLENPDYTAVQPVIVRQPHPIRLPLHSAEDAAFTVRIASVPEGETLTYQWYTNNNQLAEGGTPIEGAQSASYTPNKTQKQDCFVYCIITNTNKKRQERTVTDAVKLLITDGSLLVDAAQPRIEKQPEHYTIPIDVSREVKLEVQAVSTDQGELSYQWYQSAAPDGAGSTPIEGKTDRIYRFTPATSVAGVTYYYCMVINTNNAVDGIKTASRSSAVVKVEIEEAYPLVFAVENSDCGSITALCKGVAIGLNTLVRQGDVVYFVASPKSGYEVEKWVGAVPISDTMAVVTIKKAEDAKNISVRFREKQRKLTVKPKEIKNIDLVGKKGTKYGYFIFDLRARFGNTAGEEFTSIWARREGQALTGDYDWYSPIYLQKNEKRAPMKVSGKNKETFADYSKDIAKPVSGQCFQLDTKLIQYDFFQSSSYAYEQLLSDYQQGIIEFVYDGILDVWTCRNAAGFSLPAGVSVQFEKDTVLRRGKEQDVTLTYVLDAKDTGYVSGSVELTYTLKWE